VKLLNYGSVMQITEEAQFFGPLFAVKKLEKMG
jgi:hypothetical protein